MPGSVVPLAMFEWFQSIFFIKLKKNGLELVDEEDKCRLEEKVEDDPAVKKCHFSKSQNVSPYSKKR